MYRIYILIYFCIISIIIYQIFFSSNGLFNASILVKQKQNYIEIEKNLNWQKQLLENEILKLKSDKQFLKFILRKYNYYDNNEKIIRFDISQDKKNKNIDKIARSNLIDKQLLIQENLLNNAFKVSVKNIKFIVYLIFFIILIFFIFIFFFSFQNATGTKTKSGKSHKRLFPDSKRLSH